MRNFAALALVLGAVLGMVRDSYAVEIVLPKCETEIIYASDGTTCVNVAVTNSSAQQTSKQNYTVRWQNGTVLNDNNNGVGQGVVANCHITSITAHETEVPTGRVTITVS